MNPYIIQKPQYLLSVFSLDALPKNFKNEIAFIGRSNVGKSSLINFLMSRRNLARVSRTPGRTRALNLFSAQIVQKEKDDIKKERLGYFIDLPGLGYAKMSQADKEFLSSLLTDYINLSRSKTLLFYLLDSRREISQEDINLCHFLKQSKQKIITVLTKIDEIPFHKRKPLLSQTAEKLLLPKEDCIAASSHENLGRDLLLAKIWEHLT